MDFSNLDIALLRIHAKEFVEPDYIPEEKEYLLHYFRGKIQRKFIITYILIEPFVDKTIRNRRHVVKEYFETFTGIESFRNLLYPAIDKIDRLESELKKAKAELDFEKITLIKTGKFQLD